MPETQLLEGRANSNLKKLLKEKKGNTITNPEKQIERWKEHFEEVLNGTSVAEPPDLAPGEELVVNMER